MNNKECARLLLKKDNILLLTHKNPDGDTVGSAAALCSALRRAGKNAVLYDNPQFTKKLRPYAEEFVAPKDFAPDYVVAVDIAEPSLFPNGYEGRADLCIDHHPSNSHYAAETLLGAEKAACGEVIFKLIKAMELKITRTEATLLYIAISTDTGCFLYNNTKADTFAAASELLRAGADSAAVNLAFFRKVSAARIRLEGLMYNAMRFYRDGKITIVTVTKAMLEESGVGEDDLDDLSGLAGRVEGSVVSVTIREGDEGQCRVSVRSGKEVNSSTICSAFGGGGHAAAAGCTIQATPEKAAEMLLDVINEVWK